MNSIRELIAENIVTTLIESRSNATANVQLNKVVRDPVVIEDLSRTSFPLVFVESSNESREDISMGGSAITRQGSIEFNLHLHVNGESRDSVRNDLIQLIESSLEADRTRNGNALDTQITEIELIQSGESKPYASMLIVVVCDYCYTKGAS